MRRNAYTYIELLVVMAVIGVLVALLLPAVQAAREAARRANCDQNLVQLVLATHTYEVHHNVYPPGTIDPLRPILSQPSGYHHNWITQLLPYLDQRMVFHKVNFDVGVYDPKNGPIRSLPMRVLHCPSGPQTPGGYSDYAGVHSSIETPIDIDNNGVFFLNSHIRYDDLLDGSSHTMFFGEKNTLAGDLGWMSGTRSTLRNAGVGMNLGRGGGWMAARNFQSWNVPAKAAGLEDQIEVENASNEALISRLIGPPDSIPFPAREDGPRLKPIKRPRDARLAVGGFSSPHPGGALFAFGDGSVNFLSEVVDGVTYHNFAHRSDGGLVTGNR